ncbi:MAG TPA: DUF6603 domain-containing protein, partial [Solirubrobacteraceae bacterium]|nr:DUF6603 domain-containing protein [Solirubrobacteraceae bacterium]
MADARPIHARVLDELHDVLEFALAMLADPEGIGGVLLDEQPLAEAREKLQRLEAFEHEDLGIAENLVRIGDASARLVEIARLIRLSAEGSEDPLVVPQTIVDLLALAYLEERWPLAVHTARLFAFIDEQIRYDRVVAFVGDVAGYVKDNLDIDLEPQTEAEARRGSLLLTLAAVFFWSLQARDKPGRAQRRLNYEVLHGWEPTVGLDRPRADEVSERMLTVGARFLHRDAPGEAEAAIPLFCTIALVPAEHGGPGLWWTFAAGAEIDAPIGKNGWHFVADATFADGVDWFLPLGDAATDGFVRTGGLEGTEAGARYERRDESAPGVATQPWRLPGFEVRNASFALRVAQRGPILELRLRDAAFVLEPGSGSWLGGLLPEGARIDFDLGVGLTRDLQLVFDGGSGLRALVPVSRRLGPVHVQTVLAELKPGAGGSERIDLELSAGLALHIRDGDAKAALVADRLGMVMRLDTSAEPEDRFSIDELLPTSVGVAVDGWGVKGGGFLYLDRERGRYGGVLELTFNKLALKAFGLLTEREDGGWSLVFVLSLERELPGLPFGLRLIGAGGIFGLHHRLDP